MAAKDNTKRILALHSRIAAVNADKRFEDGRRQGHDLRIFIVGYFWACFEFPTDTEARWDRTKELAGLATHSHGPQHTGYRLKGLYAADLPRYEPVNFYQHALCQVPMQRGPRAGEPCNKNGTYGFRVTNGVTGEWDTRGWCRQHESYASEARELERITPKPTPMPNTGGLLPGYIHASNWPDIYKATRPSWEPPSIGIDANDWPVLAKIAEKAITPQFEALTGGGEDSDLPAPMLRLVSS